MAHVDEWLEFWKRITRAGALDRGRPHRRRRWWGDRYTKAEFHERLNVVARSSATSSPRPATCCTTTGRRTSPASWNRSCLNRRAFLPATIRRPFRKRALTMDIEHINAIGNLLADLTARTDRAAGVSLTTTSRRCG